MRRMKKKGQFGLAQLISAAVAFMVLSLVIVLSTGILEDEYNDRATEGDANVTLAAEQGVEGILKFAEKQTTLASAIVAVAVILVIMSVVGAVRMR